jgi:signal transduction histidine kinase/ActR/RegA family two-component response regulator
MKELERQNAFINAVLAQVPAAIVVADAGTGRLRMSNAEAHRIVGHEYEAGRRLEDYGNTYILEAFRPDGSRYVSGQWPLDRALRGETAVREEIELVLRDRSRVTIRVNAGPIRVGDEVVAAVVAFHDISDRKAVEQTARFLADASATLAGLVDDEITLQRVASLSVPTFADWAVVDMAEGGGRSRRLAVAHSDPSKLELALELNRRYPPDREAPHGVPNVLRTGRSELMGEITDAMLVSGARDEDHLRILRELGLKSYICVPLLVRGETLGVLSFVSAESGRRYDEHDLAVAEDLASRAAIAIENARLYGELKEADRSKNEFLATLAHELRNPLVAIRNVLHLMREASGNGEGNEAERAMAERQVVHLTRLIDDLMDVARISRGKIELHKQVVDLATIVGQAVETSRPLFLERRHRLTLSLPEGAIRLEADPTRLEQIFWNLLNNAAKYTPPGGRIALSVEPDGGEVVLRVRDSGIGIKPEMLPRIFDMFVQVGEHKDHAQGGLGIGLSLVRTLVRMHGGSITAHSDGPDEGCEFVVRLPVLPRTRRVDAMGPDRRRDSVDKPPCRRILVVDDNIDAARSLELLLARVYGQDVRLANNGPEALSVAGEFHPDVVLLDIGLPGMDGNEVARRLRDRPDFESTLIVALTGWGQESDVERSRAAGFDHHLVKPANPDAILGLLRKTRERGNGTQAGG